MRGQTQFCVWSPRHLLLVMRICRGWYHVITITSRDPAVSVIAEMTTKIFSQTLDQDPRSCVTDTDRHDVNLKSETYSQIIKGGRGQSVLYSCPCNGHVKDPNFTTPLPPTLSSYQHQPLLLLFRSVHFQSSDISWKDSGAGSWGQWGRKFSGIYLTLLLSESGGYFCHAWHRNI